MFSQAPESLGQHIDSKGEDHPSQLHVQWRAHSSSVRPNEVLLKLPVMRKVM